MTSSVETTVPYTVLLDEDVYRYLVQQTRYIGEDASSILRRLLGLQTSTDRHSVSSSKNGTSLATLVHGPSASLLEYVGSGEFRYNRTATDRFLAVLGFLHREDPDAFAKVLDIAGRRRTYFGRAQQDVALSGKSTHPQRIPGSDYWVMTNADTEQKQEILTRVLHRLGYPSRVAKQVSSAVGQP